MSTPALAAPQGGAVTSLPVRAIAPGGTNPRKRFDPDAMRELVESVKAHGVLQPVLVRPWNSPQVLDRVRRLPKGALTADDGSFYELIAGERRWRAAQDAGLDEIPALVRALDDDQVLEIQVVENLQRQDLHPLEECEGYMRLRRAGYDVARIAERVGRSVAYIYDRLRLANLTSHARRLFEEGKIQAGHAVLLARLTADQQTLAIETEFALFSPERTLFDPRGADEIEAADRADPMRGMKASTVRELQAWIDEHCKLDVDKQADLEQLFPEVAAAVDQAAAAGAEHDEPRKVVQVTYESYVRPTARDGSKIYGPRSWKEATKPCPHLATGVVVVGPGRGAALTVCLEKKKCRVHWGAEIRAHEKAVKAGEAAAAAGGKTGAARIADREKAAREQYERERRERDEKDRQWRAASADILAALAEGVKKAAVKELGDIVVDAVCANGGLSRSKAAERLGVPRGEAVETLQHAALIALAEAAAEWNAWKTFPPIARALGVDLKPVLAKHAPKTEPEAPPTKPARKGKGGR
jgi:ParB/RepB/Spo0J family partition protein